MSNRGVSGLSCLLCGSGEIGIRDSLKAEDILKCWALAGREFSTSVTRPFLEEGVIHLYYCLGCGFQFFSPKLAGTAEFYEQLHAGGAEYYAPDRPENERNVRFAVGRGYCNMLDLGCGSGFALDAAKRAGLETYGIELSQTAAAEASKRGHKVFPVLLEDLDRVWEGKFDLISLNQLLEHVPDPVGLVKQCIRFLSPRGTIAIAVPGADGILRFNPWLPGNWPPHHLSRWRKKDFRQLAERSGLRVVETGGNQLLGSEIQLNLLDNRANRSSLQKTSRGLPPLAIKALCLVYRKAGLKYLFNSQGHSIYCYLGRASENVGDPLNL